MTTHQTKISQYTVDLDTDMDGATGCWISVKSQGVEYTSSLAALEAAGALEASTGETWQVPGATIDKISAWAELKGH